MTTDRSVYLNRHLHPQFFIRTHLRISADPSPRETDASIHNPHVPGGISLPADCVVEERVQVLTPRLAGRRRANHVFENHVPTNDERPQLAHAHVTANKQVSK